MLIFINMDLCESSLASGGNFRHLNLDFTPLGIDFGPLGVDFWPLGVDYRLLGVNVFFFWES